MTCIKTGCHAYLTQYGEYVYGDAHTYGNVLVIRAVEFSHTPIVPRLHFEVKDIGDVWDRHLADTYNATLIATSWIDHGYDGIPTPEFRT